MNWRSTTRVFCDRHINESLRFKIYTNVTPRPSFSMVMNTGRLIVIVIVIRTSENSLSKIGLSIKIDVGQLQPKSQLKQCWSDTLNDDLRVSRLHPDQTHD